MQIEIERRKLLGKHYSSGGLFASKVVCGECGGFYGPKVWHSTDPYRTVIWRCNQKYQGKPCRCPHIREDELTQRFQTVIKRILSRKPIIMATCQEAIQSILTLDEERLTRLRQQADDVAEKVRSLITLRARAEGDDFKEEYERLTGQYARIVKRIEALETEKAEKAGRARKIELFIGSVDREELDVVQFAAFLDKAVVGGTKRDVMVRSVLVDGSEWEG